MRRINLRQGNSTTSSDIMISKDRVIKNAVLLLINCLRSDEFITLFDQIGTKIAYFSEQIEDAIGNSLLFAEGSHIIISFMNHM
jgi:hypothetical protein